MKSVEDHGYILDFGLGDVAGFLHYKTKSSENECRRRVGSLVDVVVEKLADDGRTCIFTADKDTSKKSLVCIFGGLLLLYTNLPPLNSLRRYQISLPFLRER